MQAIIGGFRTVACYIAKSEAGIKPVSLRHYHQQRNIWIKWHTKPLNQHFWKVKTALSLGNKRWISPLQKIVQKFKQLDVSCIEKIGAYTKNPLTNPLRIFIMDNKKQAADLAKSHKRVATFVDSSVRNDLVGIGVYWQDILWFSISDTIASTSTFTNSLGKLARIEAVVARIWNAVTQHSLRNLEVTIFSDSQYALKALEKLDKIVGSSYWEVLHC